MLVRNRVVKNYKFKKASFLAHIKWANSYRLRQKVALVKQKPENIQAIYNFKK